jgi:hypothetical protein
MAPQLYSRQNFFDKCCDWAIFEFFIKTGGNFFNSDVFLLNSILKRESVDFPAKIHMDPHYGSNHVVVSASQYISELQFSARVTIICT